MSIGISIDFFDTLVEIDRDVATIGTRLTQLGFPCSPAVEAIWNSCGFDGQITHNPNQDCYEEWRRAAIMELARLCGAPEARVEAIADELLMLDQQWTVRARQGAQELLAAIRHYNAQVCILTNWDYPLAPYLEMSGLGPIPAITSAEMGCRKPLILAFEKARSLMKIGPTDHIHIGDSWTADVVGAIRSGARSIWITDHPPAEALPPSIIASTLEEAPKRLAEMLKPSVV